MRHEEIEQREVIESYVRGRLTAEERLAFEEHYFVCDQCFADVQTLERFVSGVSYAAEAGLLAPATPSDRVAVARRLFNLDWPDWQIWLKPAFAFAFALALALSFLSGWLLLRQLPQLRAELARERQSHTQVQQEQQQSLAQTQAELESTRRQQSELENQLAQARAAAAAGGPEPNLPLVMLEATRAGQTVNEITLPKGAQSIVLWIEPGLSADYASFRLVVQKLAGQTIQTVEGLRRNSYGALVVSLPAAQLPGARYRVRLYGVSGQQAALITEYQLQVRKR
jgi:hypothetical protein